MGGVKDRLDYPSAKREDKTLSFSHGHKASDYYQWLENTNSADVKTFAISQNAVTAAYLDKCEELEKIRAELRSLSSHKTMSCPTEHSGTNSLYFLMTEDSGKPDSLYFQQGLKGKPKPLVKPKGSCFVTMHSLSRDGKTLAFALGSRGSNWMTVRFKELPSGKSLPDVLSNVCMSDLCWTSDGKGILYSCYCNDKASDHKIAFHRLGSDQMDDIVLVEFPNANMTLQAQLSATDNMIFVYGHMNDEDQNLHFYYGDFNFTIDDDYASSPLLFHLVGGKSLEIKYITNEGNTVYFHTNQGAALFKIIKISLCTYDKRTYASKHLFETVVPEDPSRILDWAVCVNKTYLMVCYLQDATHQLELRRLEDGAIVQKYKLEIGTILDYFGDRDCPRFYFIFTSFTTPDCIRYIDVSHRCCGKLTSCCCGKKKIKNFNKGLNKQVNTSGYRVKHLLIDVPAETTQIPIFVIHKKDFKTDGNSPCIVYAQGCFGIQTMPSFSISKWMFLKHFGGAIAIVGVRGGGELGPKWCEDGHLLNKPNTYNDFIEASQYLIKAGYASNSKLIAEGEAYGGNVVGVCVTQRPDLYCAVIIHDGLLDMLRCHTFEESKVYLSEFGTPDNEENFEIIRHFTPLQNTLVSRHRLPPILVTLGKEACLSHPSNSFKFVAQVQYDSKKYPCVLRYKGRKSPESSAMLSEDLLFKIDERADIFAFLMQTLKLDLKL